MNRARKAAANALIAAYLTFCLVDAPPLVSPTHARLKARLDPILDATGLWQESWQLFAPEPKKLNVSASAKFYLADGLTLQWNSPRWVELNVFEKFFSVRHMKFYYLLTRDVNRASWRSFALYRRSLLPSSVQDDVVRVELWRHWKMTPPPDQEWMPAGRPIEPDEERLFFTLERQ